MPSKRSASCEAKWNYLNYYKKYYKILEDLDYSHDKKPDYERIYYKYMNEVKLPCNYILKKLEDKEEMHQIEKMSSKVLESIIEKLVLGYIKKSCY